MNSLLGQLNDDYEVIVVDNFSTDGTYEILRNFEQRHGVKVIQRRCSRGLGRQIAFEKVSGVYVIANLDLDDVFLPVIGKVMELYLRSADGRLMVIFNPNSSPGNVSGWSQNMTIGPRELIESIGGWRDLNVFEDWDVWSRAAQVQKYCWTNFRFAANEPFHPEQKRPAIRMAKRYERYRDRLRLRMRIFSPGEEVGVPQWVAYIAARISIVFKGTMSGQNPEFVSQDHSFFVELSASKVTETNS